MTDDNAEIVKALAWLIDNSEGVAGLRLDGAVLPWSEVVGSYLPRMSGGWLALQLREEDDDD